MIIYKKTLLLLCALFVLITNACKIDEAPPFVPVIGANETVLGITVVGKVINDAYLTSEWKPIRTTQQFYDTAYAAVLLANPMQSKFTSVTLNDEAKTFQYKGLTNSSIVTSGTYKLYTTNNVLFIDLPGNPLLTSPACTVRITNLTARSMTWVVIDPTIVPVNGQPAREACEVVFTK